ncbi:hypothetical protein Tco_1166288 [Tanacetum coccineum]
MENENPICTIGDYSKPSYEGYRNTIELPAGNNVVPLRSDTIRLVQNGCSFHEFRSEDPNQHLQDFLKLVDSLDLDGENKERTRLSNRRFGSRICDDVNGSLTVLVHDIILNGKVYTPPFQNIWSEYDTISLDIGSRLSGSFDATELMSLSAISM